MSRPLRISSALALAALTASLAFGGGACAPDSDLLESEEEVAATEHPLDVKPGDPVSRHGVTVLAPAARGAIFAEVLLESGETRTLHLRTDEDGRVFELPDALEDLDPHDLEGDDDLADLEDEVNVVGEAAGEATASNSPKPCSDGAKTALPYKWGKKFTWFFQASSTPNANSATNVEAKLKRAVGNVTASRNSCGLADEVSATQSYGGRTSKATGIASDATCSTSDGQNTVGFGALPQGTLGLACVWYAGDGLAVEADVRLNTKHAWYADKPASCSGRYSVEAVMTHEFGHVFGLGHVSEATHGNLTMSTQINGACQNAEATLGLGDVRALRAKY